MYQYSIKFMPMIGIVATVLLAICRYSLAQAPDPTDDHGLSVWVIRPISSEMILPSALPKPKSMAKAITINACPGEFEPASFALRSSTKISDIQLKVSSLKGDQGTIPADKIVIKVVKAWFQSAGAWKNEYRREAGEPVLVPELLLSDDSLVRVDDVKRKNYLKLSFPAGDEYVSISDPTIQKKRIVHDSREYPVSDAPRLLPFTLEGNETKQIWITVQVPDNASAGVYRGTIDLTTPSSSLGVIDLRLEVLPFRLETSGLTYSLYYRGQLWSGSGTVSSEYKSPKQLRTELINMRDHGIQNPTVYQGNRNPQSPPKLPERKKQKLLEDYLVIRRELGMDRQPVYLMRMTGNPASEQGLQRLEKIVEELFEVVRPFGVTDLYLYGSDEAKGEALTSQRRAWERVRLAGAKIFAAGYKKHYEPMADLTDLLVMYGPPSRKDAQRIHGMGNKLFNYHNPQSGPENPLVFRLNYGLELWRSGYDGAMIYAYQHSGNGSVWNDFDNSKWRDHNLTYPTASGVIDTIAWEGLREAVDDVRYINTLETVIRRAEITAKDNELASVRAAKSFLSDLKEKDLRKLDLDAVRHTVSEHVTRINGLLQHRE